MSARTEWRARNVMCQTREREGGTCLFEITINAIEHRTLYALHLSLSPCAHIPRILLPKLNNREGDLNLLAEAGQTTDRPPAESKRESTRLYKDAEEAGGDGNVD